jgi:hypothetical protein
VWWPVTEAGDATSMADRKPSSQVRLVKREGRKGTGGGGACAEDVAVREDATEGPG